MVKRKKEYGKETRKQGDVSTALNMTGRSASGMTERSGVTNCAQHDKIGRAHV